MRKAAFCKWHEIKMERGAFAFNIFFAGTFEDELKGSKSNLPEILGGNKESGKTNPDEGKVCRREGKYGRVRAGRLLLPGPLFVPIGTKLFAALMLINFRFSTLFK